jgi:flagellar motility protein MotE (MotC chaperone)
MKLLLYVLIALVAFCGVVVGTLYFKGMLNREALASLKGTVASEGGDTEAELASEEGQYLTTLATALKEKENQLAQREEDIARDEKRLDQERKELESIRKEIDALLKRMEQQVETLDGEREKELDDLAKTYAAMEQKKAGEILSKMPVEDAVRILKRITTRQRGPIVQEMTNAREVSEAIIRELGE